ncbi:hypothetical protein Rsub_04625 [Raphidocelis subcapitata]|uniref:snRNA-activating protein complex subunit 3 n=1 Tax=Raphidocelis subcapitata TaxID=307507 RepID=A0A2V0NY12_9CHLO|nr:hypothetical protein Rsub_04625 [Raphidocelis subcapitata]|eukprot:GBF92521.1 hypothetical protein Rsub_04625 [Raphidocelis subcapitata]
MGSPVSRERKRSREAGVWLKNPDLYRRLKRPSCGPAAAPPVEGAHASPPISVGAFESDAANALQWLEAQAEAVCASLGPQADEARIDVGDLRLRQLPNPHDELSFAAALDDQRQQQREQQQQQQQLEGASTSTQGAQEGGNGSSGQARRRPAEGHLFALISRQQDEERARAAQFLHSAREAREAGVSVRLPQAPQPPPVGASAAADWGGGAAGRARGDGVVVTVAVCEARHDHKSLLAELQLLGSCTLAQLRDAIRCPSSALVASAGARAPSSYFYVAGRFYSDSRDPLAAGTGERIAAFCREANVRAPLHLLLAGGGECDAPARGQQQQPPQPEPQQQEQQQQQQQQGQQQGQQQQGGASAAPAAPGPPLDAPLSDVTLADLPLCVSNRPTYLFSHAGCCEHGWFVTDIRLRTAHDPTPAPGAYPRPLYTAPPSARWGCGACGVARAAVLVLGHPDAPDDPCLLCTGCRDLLLGPGGSGVGVGVRPPYKVYSLR